MRGGSCYTLAVHAQRRQSGVMPACFVPDSAPAGKVPASRGYANQEKLTVPVLRLNLLERRPAVVGGVV